jgi:hypothetical protein
MLLHAYLYKIQDSLFWQTMYHYIQYLQHMARWMKINKQILYMYLNPCTCSPRYMMRVCILFALS